MNVDNQAAIQETHFFDCAPAHYIMDYLHETLLAALIARREAHLVAAREAGDIDLTYAINRS
ncbi:hypothetical protein BDR06DRAFT_1015646 [Suillus hirtellus]|nr:hypothetical protein BDR06DRAFT_1015646 [Suillus hirtellus]